MLMSVKTMLILQIIRQFNEWLTTLLYTFRNTLNYSSLLLNMTYLEF